MVSLILSLEEGQVVEVGLVGNEGIVGVLAGLGTSRISGEAIVQMPGPGLRIKTDVLRKEIGRRRHAMRGISCPSDWRDGC
jgi:hypothetical protein